ncbi:MAG TPA: SDR family NAD(P)-dependent oxidoreductase [Pseudomonadales bacterium]|nr:SDR family NAD(P)-dependent oxidoreductase [Pseudomonadales bacterium]
MARFEHYEDGCNALVVGASGGIGAAIARALDDEDRVTRVLRTARGGGTGDLLALDLADDDSIAACAERVAERTARLDLVVICAGLLHDEAAGVMPEKRLAQLSRSALERSFQVNAFGPLLLAAALAPLLPRRTACVWATLSARVGSIGDNRLGGSYAYRGAKAAQNQFTRTLAIELGRRHKGLACVALHPGTVATDLSAPFRSAEARGVMTPDASAGHLLDVIDGLDARASGRFLAWDGSEIPW